MATENNPINSLAAEAADADTRDLEILSVDLIPTEEELEMDADTCSLDDQAAEARSVDSLKSDLKSRDERISNLQYDIQQLRSRWTGLEKEIEAREELTEMLQAELKAAHKSIGAKDREVARQKREIDDLTSKLDAASRSGAAADADLAAAEEKLGDLTGQTEADAERITALEGELEEARGEISAYRNGEHAQNIELIQQQRGIIAGHEEHIRRLEAKLEQADAYGDYVRESLERNNAQRDERESEIARLDEALGEANNRIASLEDELADAQRRNSALQPENEELAAHVSELDGALSEARERASSLDDELGAARRRIEELEPGNDELVSRVAELDEALTEARDRRASLEEDLAEARCRIDKLQPDNDELIARVAELEEALADTRERASSLDEELSEARHTIGELEPGNEKLESRVAELDQALSEAHERVSSLEVDLGAARKSLEELESGSDEQRRKLEQELEVLRFELSEAQDTIATQDSMNGQLTAELIDTTNRRDDLSQELNTLRDANAERIAELGSRIEKLQTSLADAEEKISSKDNAITALLSELANKSQTIESIEEIESVIHEIDGRMSDRIEEETGGEAERPTRLLTGCIEGQELRFPLFKNRLTIGRTGRNDIQLRAQYISRRHAVILVEDDVTRIVDWGSKNGVFVNSARVSEQTLKNGDTVSFGTADFVYEERPRRDSA